MQGTMNIKFPFLLPSTFDIPRPSYPASGFSVLQYIYGAAWCSYTLDDFGSNSDTDGSVLNTHPRPARGTTSAHILLLLRSGVNRLECRQLTSLGGLN